MADLLALSLLNEKKMRFLRSVGIGARLCRKIQNDYVNDDYRSNVMR